MLFGFRRVLFPFSQPRVQGQFAQDISLEWLLTGEGAMLKTSTSSESPCNPVVMPFEGGDKGDMLDTINTQAHIIERMQLKIESLEALLKSQNTPYSQK